MTKSARIGSICTLTPIRALAVEQVLRDKVELQVSIRPIGCAPLGPANPGAILNEPSVAIREIRVEMFQSFTASRGLIHNNSVARWRGRANAESKCPKN